MVQSSKRSAKTIENQREIGIPKLLTDLHGNQPRVRIEAREALVALGSPAVPGLIGLLAHRKQHVRWEAAKALCDIADPISASALVNALDDDDADVRWLTAEGLAALGRDAVQPLLAALLEQARSTSFCESGHHVFHAIVKRKGLGPILRPVLAALKDFEPEVAAPVAAYNALWKLRKES